jgi:hypothetical protein
MVGSAKIFRHHVFAPYFIGVNTSLTEENVAPGLGPPEMTYIELPTIAAPRPCLAVGMGAQLSQLLFAGS